MIISGGSEIRSRERGVKILNPRTIAPTHLVPVPPLGSAGIPGQIATGRQIEYTLKDHQQKRQLQEILTRVFTMDMRSFFF